MEIIRNKSFQPGRHVVVREIWQGQVWTARPEIVVYDTPELLVMYIPHGTHWKQARSLNDTKVSVGARKTGEWKLADAVWQGEGRLRLTIPGCCYSVLAFWHGTHDAIAYWYINLEDPLTRTLAGFDYMDQLLDVIIQPDLKNWYWKDEGEFQEAQYLGLISDTKAKMFRTEGEKARKLIQSGMSVFNNWDRWKPEPSWKVPVLPDEWDIV